MELRALVIVKVKEVGLRMILCSSHAVTKRQDYYIAHAMSKEHYVGKRCKTYCIMEDLLVTIF